MRGRPKGVGSGKTAIERREDKRKKKKETSNLFYTV
jgi:hypothetical protein